MISCKFCKILYIYIYIIITWQLVTSNNTIITKQNNIPGVFLDTRWFEINLKKWILFEYNIMVIPLV